MQKNRGTGNFSPVPRSTFMHYSVFFRFRQAGQRQQDCTYKPEPAGGQRRQPVHVPQDHRPGADVRQYRFGEAMNDSGQGLIL